MSNTANKAGQKFDAMLEEIVAMANRLQVRRVSFEQIEEEDQWILVAQLGLARDDFQRYIERIDGKLSEILDRKLENAP